MLKRNFDILMSLTLLIILFPIICILYVLIFLDDGAPVIYWSRRIGKNKVEFQMPKFRTMKKNCPQVATHLLSDEKSYLIRSGSFLRKTSLDEIPQLWSVVSGEMSLVGPRPALFNQDDLVDEREVYHLNSLRPGITGWAQINGRDSISIKEKVQKDFEYLENQNFIFDLKIIWLSVFAVLRRKDIRH